MRLGAEPIGSVAQAELDELSAVQRAGLHTKLGIISVRAQVANVPHKLMYGVGIIDRSTYLQRVYGTFFQQKRSTFRTFFRRRMFESGYSAHDDNGSPEIQQIRAELRKTMK